MAKPLFSASSFLTEVLTTAGQKEKDDIGTKLNKLSKRIDEVKVEVYDTLQRKYEEFQPDLKTTMQLHDRVQTLSGEMDTMAVKIEKEIKTKLQASTSEFQNLSEQLKEANTRHAILGKLVYIHDNMEAIEKDRHVKNYVGAANRLDLIGARLQEPAHEHENEVRILSVLQSQHKLQTEKLKQDISTAWGCHVSWELPEESAKNKTVILKIDRSEKSQAVLKNITQALYNIAMLDPKLKIFSDRLTEYILKFAVCKQKFVMDQIDNQESVELTCTYSINTVEDPVRPETVYERLRCILNFLNENLFSLEIDTQNSKEKQPIMALLGEVLAASFQEFIVNKCLAHSIPSHQQELETFKSVISDTETFHSQLVNMKFMDCDDKTLLDFVNNINVHFANKKCQEILERARNLMTSELHNMVQVCGDHPFGELPPLDFGSSKKDRATEPLSLPADMKLSASIFKMPTFCVSMHAQGLMELSYETIHEATNSSPQCAIQLFYAIRNMYELYCSVVPAYHKDSLETLPQLSALQHNNYMYLAHHLLTMGHQYRAKLPPPLNQGAATFIDLVPCLRRLGTECFLAQLSKQRDQLLDILKQARGFSAVSDSDNMQTAERCMKQVMYQLEHLNNIWQPVLPPNIYCKAIGTLLNSVMVDIMTSLTSLEDISADDATQLHSVMSLLTARGPHLFKEENNTESSPVIVHQFVRKWTKFSEILLLLNANLQGINERWADGKGPLAHECSATEVKQMIRALFQNTDRRAAVLARIK